MSATRVLGRSVRNKRPRSLRSVCVSEDEVFRYLNTVDGLKNYLDSENTILVFIQEGNFISCCGTTADVVHDVLNFKYCGGKNNDNVDRQTGIPLILSLIHI